MGKCQVSLIQVFHWGKLKLILLSITHRIQNISHAPPSPRYLRKLVGHIVLAYGNVSLVMSTRTFVPCMYWYIHGFLAGPVSTVGSVSHLAFDSLQV